MAVTSNLDLGNANLANLQFTDFTINSGATLTVPSGAVIRCTGTFTNNGRIVVQAGATGGSMFAHLPIATTSISPAEAGVSLHAAGTPEWGDSTGTRSGGPGGTGITSGFQARQVRYPGIKAGGSGSGPSSTAAGGGGGSLVVLAETAIVNAGSGISADGEDAFSAGGGGGAGGVVILASAGSVTNSAPISVKGGAGGVSDSSVGPGGGGGGGLARLIAPSVTETGGFVTGGGSAGSKSGIVNSTVHAGGGGGGACIGNGGSGGLTSPGTASSPGDATSGNPGVALVDRFDPTSLF